jgi:hypothetical protein
MNITLTNSTLFLAIILVGALAYMGTIAFDPTHPAPRLIAGYLCGIALVFIGLGSLYYGAAFELPLIFDKVYLFETIHMEWLGLGAMAFIVGLLCMRQAFNRR